MTGPPSGSLLERLRGALGSRYEVVRELGHGGMATVFLADDPRHRRRVAIKVLDPGIARAIGSERFEREIELLARLQHPHVLPLHDSGVGDGVFWYAMPFVDGESLRDRLAKEGRLGVEETVRLGAQIARALDYAHRQGVVHRDVKPENVLLADGQAVVADFGIARALRGAGATLTGTGVRVGTPLYMSPEQITAEREVDGRADVYALGCVLHEMLAGQPPFSGPAETLVHQHLNVTPRSLTELRPGVSPSLAAVVERALAKAPGDRFATAGQMADALEATITGSHAVTPITPAAATPAIPAAPRARHAPPWTWAAVALVAVALVAAGVAWRAGVFAPRAGAGGGEPSWVWLAAFEGPADDPTLASAARDLVATALDQSDRLATVPHDQVRIALRNAGRPDSTVIDLELARQLAYRSGIPIVVAGKVSRVGGGYHVSAQALEAESGKSLVVVDETAVDAGGLIPALTRVARQVRRRLGERPAAGRDMLDAPTPSFDAFRLFARARELINANYYERGIPLLRAAIATDPEFATAWAALGTAHVNLGALDSAGLAFEEALRHGDRMTPYRRRDVLAKMARLKGRHVEANEHYEAMLALDPSPAERAVAHNNYALGLARLGRHEEALAHYTESVRSWPIQAPILNLLNLNTQFVVVGRFDEARAMLPRLPGWSGDFARQFIAHNARDWPVAESLCTTLVSEASTPAFFRGIARIGAASAIGARGATRQALARVREQEEALAAMDATYADGVWIVRAGVELAAGHEAAALPARVPTGSAIRALRAAWVGDATGARAPIARLWTEDTAEQRAAVAEHLEGALAWRRGDWGAAIERLAPMARVGEFNVGSPFENLRVVSRWMVADAFLRQQQADSAIVYLDYLLEPPAQASHLIEQRGLIEPYVRARRVRALAAAGRLDEARRDWDTLAKMLRTPDPELVALLDETRGAVQAAPRP